jgi:hypothetical protein
MSCHSGHPLPRFGHDGFCNATECLCLCERIEAFWEFKIGWVTKIFLHITHMGNAPRRIWFSVVMADAIHATLHR